MEILNVESWTERFPNRSFRSNPEIETDNSAELHRFGKQGPNVFGVERTVREAFGGSGQLAQGFASSAPKIKLILHGTSGPRPRSLVLGHWLDEVLLLANLNCSEAPPESPLRVMSG
jgi:hypothetical protein